jgi:hypothetical protein
MNLGVRVLEKKGVITILQVFKRSYQELFTFNSAELRRVKFFTISPHKDRKWPWGIGHIDLHGDSSQARIRRNPWVRTAAAFNGCGMRLAFSSYSDRHGHGLEHEGT